MTKEECMQALSDAANDYEIKTAPLYRAYKAKCNKILNKWANENARFKIGDIIGNIDRTIKIDTITGMRLREPMIQYSGHTIDAEGVINPYQFGILFESDSTVHKIK